MHLILAMRFSLPRLKKIMLRNIQTAQMLTLLSLLRVYLKNRVKPVWILSTKTLLSTNIYSISFASKSEIIVWNESDIEADTDRIGIVGSPTVVRRILEPKKKEKNKIAFEVPNIINAQVGVTWPLTELDIFFN